MAIAKKVVLLNIQHVDNYGANLIAYSMEREMRLLLGDESEIITANYCPSNLEKGSFYQRYKLEGARKTAALYRHKTAESIRKFSHKIPFTKAIRKKLKKAYQSKNIVEPVYRRAVNNSEQLERNERFNDFRQRALNLSGKLSSSLELCELKADAYVVGSDVVWKPLRAVNHEREAFFLKFPTKGKRIAYAASIGMDDKAVLKRMKHIYRKNIKDFDSISVREKSIVDYVQALTEKKVYNCIDPTLLRTRSEYESLLENLPAHCKKPDRGYIYVYVLGTNSEAYRCANELSQKYSLDIVCHVSEKEKLKGNVISSVTDGPLEFLERIKNAEYIITDSFHGTAFSIIFEKKFLTFTRGTMSARLKSFLSDLKLEEKLVDTLDDCEKINTYMDYSRVNEAIEKWVQQSRDYLKSALEDKGDI